MYETRRQLISDVVAGTVNEENNPGVFEEDGLYLAAQIIEKRDPEWLRDALDEALSCGRRVAPILECLSPAGRARFADLFDERGRK